MDLGGACCVRARVLDNFNDLFALATVSLPSDQLPRQAHYMVAVRACTFNSVHRSVGPSEKYLQIRTEILVVAIGS